jgi:hypothetical protein
MIALNMSRDSGVVMTTLGVTKKQYYSRMNRLVNAGLVMRKNGAHLLTSLGKVVYESHMLIGHAVENYWKLKAIDSIETSLADQDIYANELERIIDALIEREKIKSILLNHSIPSGQNKKVDNELVLSNLKELAHVSSVAN